MMHPDHIDPHDLPPDHLSPHQDPAHAIRPADLYYLRRQQIDTVKWDACIDRAPNGLIYGRSFYLDFMTEGQWDALVLEDYKAVMPLTWNRKWGIKYLYQPPFTQQLGIFSDAAIAPTLIQTSPSASPGAIVPTPIQTSPPASAGPANSASAGIGTPASLANAFLHRLTSHFRFAEIFLNYNNAHPSLRPCTNYILDLAAPYDRLAGNYNKDLVRDLRIAARSSLRYVKDFDLPAALSRHKDLYQDRTPHVKEEAYSRFAALCRFLQNKGQLLVKAITDSQQRTLATALLPSDKDRIYLIQSTNIPAGRQTAANHFLLDRLIAEFAGQPMILDFEGSDLPGVAHFYRNFGGQNQPYFFYRHNNLPWPLRLLK